MRVESQSPAELWLRKCGTNLMELKKPCQAAEETATSLRQDIEGAPDLDVKRSRRAVTALHALKKMSDLCEWGVLLDWYVQDDSTVTSVEAINLPALANWSAYRHLGDSLINQDGLTYQPKR
jgi:hypothetical protein